MKKVTSFVPKVGEPFLLLLFVMLYVALALRFLGGISDSKGALECLQMTSPLKTLDSAFPWPSFLGMKFRGVYLLTLSFGVGLYYLYKHFSFLAAVVFAVGFTVCSYSYAFGTVIGAEATLVFYSLGAALLFFSFLQRHNRFSLMGAAGLATWAFLLNPTALALFVVFIFEILKMSPHQRRWRFAVFGVVLALMLPLVLFALQYGLHPLISGLLEYLNKTYEFFVSGAHREGYLISFFDEVFSRVHFPFLVSIVIGPFIYINKSSRYFATLAWGFLGVAYLLNMLTGLNSNDVKSYMFACYVFGALAFAIACGHDLARQRRPLFWGWVCLGLVLLGLGIGFNNDPSNVFVAGKITITKAAKTFYNAGVLGVVLLLVLQSWKPGRSTALALLLLSALWTSAYSVGIVNAKFIKEQNSADKYDYRSESNLQLALLAAEKTFADHLKVNITEINGKRGYGSNTKFQKVTPAGWPFGINERQEWAVKWTGFNAGSFSLEALEGAQIANEKSVRYRASIKNSPALNYLFKVDDVFESWHSLSTHQPLRQQMRIIDSGQCEQRTALFDPKAQLSLMVSRRKKRLLPEVIKSEIHTYNGAGQEFLGALYFLRFFEPANIPKVMVVDGEKEIGIEFRSQGLATVNTTLGTFEAVQTQILVGKLVIEAWLSNDHRRLMLKWVAHTKVGNVSGELVKYSPGQPMKERPPQLILSQSQNGELESGEASQK